MHNPVPVLENDTHKLLWEFNIQTDHLIPARRPDLIIINKKKKRIWKIVDVAVTADHRINLKESEKKDTYLDLARELKKLWNMKVTIVPIVIGALGTITKGLLKGLKDLEVGGRVETIQTTALLRNGQNPETSPGDLRRLAVTQTPMKNHQLTLMWKTLIIIMKVTIIPILIGATITKGLVQGLDDMEITGREETVQTTALFRSDRILRWVLET